MGSQECTPTHTAAATAIAQRLRLPHLNSTFRSSTGHQRQRRMHAVERVPVTGWLATCRPLLCPHGASWARRIHFISSGYHLLMPPDLTHLTVNAHVCPCNTPQLMALSAYPGGRGTAGQHAHGSCTVAEAQHTPEQQRMQWGRVTGAATWAQLSAAPKCAGPGLVERRCTCAAACRPCARPRLPAGCPAAAARTLQPLPPV